MPLIFLCAHSSPDCALRMHECATTFARGPVLSLGKERLLCLIWTPPEFTTTAEQEASSIEEIMENEYRAAGQGRARLNWHLGPSGACHRDGCCYRHDPSGPSSTPQTGRGPVSGAKGD